MRKFKFYQNNRMIAVIIVSIVTLSFIIASCMPSGGTGASMTTSLPFIQSITAQVMVLAPTSPTATSSPTATTTPAATVSPTASPSMTMTPTTTVSPTITAMPSATVSPTATASPAATASPSVTPSPSATAAAVGSDIMVSVQVANFNVVNKLGQAAVPGEGHLHFFLDAVPPILQGTPAISAPGTYVAIPATSYTWPNVKPGLHIISAELANNDHTPLATPSVASVMIWVPDSTGATMPQITSITAQTMAGAVTPSATATAAATASPSAMPSITPSATASMTPTSTASPATTVSPSVMPSITPSATTPIYGTATPTQTSTPSATMSPTITAMPSAIVSPTATASPEVSPSATAASGGASIMVSIQSANFNIVSKEGQAAATGEGHVHFFLDAIPPTFPNIASVTGPGTYVHIEATTYTWFGVMPGVHILSAELVNNDHTPLNPPVVASVVLTVMPAGVVASPTASVSPAVTTTPSVTASPSATATPSVTVSPSVTTSPTATASPSVSTSPTATASPSGGATTISLTAQNIAFDKTTITVPAGSQVTVNFNNMDSGIPHSFSVYTNSTASTPIFVGQITTGPATMTYTFTAPTTPGTYFFRCDVHPTIMTGQFIVQ